jgi:hypothetical protein
VARRKKIMNWKSREGELINLFDKYRSSNGNFDCVVPVSGGKDGSYVAYQLKHKYGMNPLAITVKPALSLEIGDQNLTNFIQSGYNHIHISCNPIVLDRLNKYGFIEKGFPYYGWLIAIMTAVIKTAANFKIPLIFYGEDGEVEYGGSTESKNKSLYDIDYINQDVFIKNGLQKIDTPLDLYIKHIESLNVGEIYLNSIKEDGTGFGYNVDAIQKISRKIKTPLIIAGGAGNKFHLLEGIKLPKVSAVATSNLFNFMGNGLPDARKYMIEKKMQLSRLVVRRIFMYQIRLNII